MTLSRGKQWHMDDITVHEVNGECKHTQVHTYRQLNTQKCV